jgi:hypothetical protein
MESEVMFLKQIRKNGVICVSDLLNPFCCIQNVNLYFFTIL